MFFEIEASAGVSKKDLALERVSDQLSRGLFAISLLTSSASILATLMHALAPHIFAQHHHNNHANPGPTPTGSSSSVSDKA